MTTEDNKTRILWMSNSPLTATGYGNQTRLFTPRIKSLGYEMEIFAFYGAEMFTAPWQWNGITVTGRGFHPYGMDVLPAKAKTFNADIVISLFDAWVFDLQQVNQIRWCPWFPIDSDPIPPDVLEKVRYAFARLVYSKFAQEQMENHDLDCHYIPHGVDTKVFMPLDNNVRADVRSKVFNFPQDAYVVGMVAANKGYPTRKAFEQNIGAFKMLNDKHKDTILFLQTWTGEGGPSGRECLNLVDYCRTIGLQPGKNVFFCDQFMNITTGFPDPYMVGLYNSMDVLLSVSRGEGFGIPILEAQACGTPVVTGDWTSMPEITFSGWKVSKKEAELDPTWQKSNWYLPHTGAIADRLEAAYQMRGNPDYKERARKGALPYDVDKITEKYWKPALQSISERVEKVKQLQAQISQPVKPQGTVTVEEVNG